MTKWYEVTAEDDVDFGRVGGEISSDEDGVSLSFGIADHGYYLWEEVAEAPDQWRDNYTQVVGTLRGVFSDRVTLDFGNGIPLVTLAWEEITPVVAEEESDDLVNHPDHYTVGGIETKDFIRAKVADYASYLEGNIIKYVTRYRHKGTPVQDLQKAEFYIKELIEYATEKGD